MTLQLKNLVNRGESRACYLHPGNGAKCVKVALHPGKGIKDMRREIKAYQELKDKLGIYLVCHEPHLADTDKGQGVVCDLLRDDDGAYSRNLLYYQQRGLLDEDILRQLRCFFTFLLQNNIFFFDFNYKNFLVWCKGGQKLLKYADMKSYRHTRSWSLLKMENFIPVLAKRKMKRRIIRFYAQGHLAYPEYVAAL